MKQPRLGAIGNFSFGLLFLSLLMPPAIAQQEVAPERFDKSGDTAQPRKAVSHHKSTQRSPTRRARKAVPATAKLELADGRANRADHRLAGRR